jgi:hypothetical protein
MGYAGCFTSFPRNFHENVTIYRKNSWFVMFNEIEAKQKHSL